MTNMFVTSTSSIGRNHLHGKVRGDKYVQEPIVTLVWIGEGVFKDGFEVVEHPNINETWAAMEKLLETGKVKAIGVSNFSVKTYVSETGFLTDML